MISYETGDLLRSDAEALVNTVNCVGIMGRGVALQFKRLFPANFKVYEAACQQGEVVPGRMFVYETNSLEGPRYIVNFPTKRHWRGRSRIEDIETGLVDLRRWIEEKKVCSIALPPLGSGLGGLPWDEVKQRIQHALADLPDVHVRVFEPRGDDPPLPVATSAQLPTLTPSRAMLVSLIDRYLRGLMEPFVTLLEVHKLTFFLQEAGQPLRLKFVKGLYGPYAENLRFVMREVEGYYLSGYQDGGDNPSKQITLVPGALDAANALLRDSDDVRDRFDEVASLVDGFETSTGLELLATALWSVRQEQATTNDEVYAAFQRWNARKSIFTRRQVGIAMDRLRARGWVGEAVPA